MPSRTASRERAVEIYDHVVETVRPLWHEWFQARLRLSAIVIGIHATAAAHQSVAEREASADVVRRMLATASASSTSTPSTTPPAAPNTRPG